jgi:ATP-binding cassette, subfamily B (MDR/TAP), member 1
LLVEDDESFEGEKKTSKTSKNSGSRAMLKQQTTMATIRANLWDDEKLKEVMTVKVEDKTTEQEDLEKQQDIEYENQQPFWQLVRDIYPTIPHKPLLFLE